MVKSTGSSTSLGTLDLDQRFLWFDQSVSLPEVNRKDEEEMLRRIEAEQQLINKLIEDSKRLSERSDVLVNAAREKSKKSRESEGEMEDA